MNTSLPSLAGRSRRVAVVGASGHTGRFVVSELLRRGFAPVAVGRDAARLAQAGWAGAGVTLRVASLADTASLNQALAGVQAVINCAGPFLDTADAVARAALRMGAHYFDVTAEQPSAQATLRDFDQPARAAGVFVMPAVGFYGGLADLLATRAMANWERADAITVAIALDRWWPTQGTRVTGERNTARRLVIEQGQLAEQELPHRELRWRFDPPVGEQDVVEVLFSEVILMARHLRTARLHSYLSQVALQDIRDPATPPPAASDASGQSAQRFLVEAQVVQGDLTRRVAVQGRDIYAFTAPLVVEAVQRVLDGRTRHTSGGSATPGDLFDADDYLDTLAAGGALSLAVD